MKKLIIAACLLLAGMPSVSAQAESAVGAGVAILKAGKAMANKGQKVAQVAELLKLLEELACAEQTYKDYSASVTFSSCFLKADITLIDFRISSTYLQVAALMDEIISATAPENPGESYLAISKANEDVRGLIKDLSGYLRKYEKITIQNVLQDAQKKTSSEYLTYNKFTSKK